MSRPIVLSNGEMHVALNEFGLVHEFYYPYVGLENHSAGTGLRHKIGVYVDGQMSWLDTDSRWKLTFSYPSTALIGHTFAKNEALGIILEFDDCVDAYISVFMRNIHVVNLWPQQREVRLFLHQAFAIGDSRSNTDTAQYLPDSEAILHYRGRRAFMISGQHNNMPFDQHSIGLFGIENHEGTFRDAEDGELSGSNVEHGRVDSTLRFKLNIDAHSSERVLYWIAAGTSTREANYVHKQIKDDGLLKRLHDTATWWDEWIKPAVEIAKKLPQKYQESFVDSVMIIKSQIDKRGAVIASTDTTMLNYSRDAYAYCWPRDGAYALWPLIRMGYNDEAYRFFEFCKRSLHPSGYLMHKYRADGALGSSWHTYVHENGVVAPPIQEDETALVVFMFAQYYQMHPSGSLLKDFYVSMIRPMADFMTEYVEETTSLPKPTYDLWEEVYTTTTYTVSLTYAALSVAAELASIMHDDQSAVRWQTSAADIKEASAKYLFNKSRGVFYKSITVQNGQVQYDPTIDASAVFGAFLFGLFDSDSEEVTSSVKTLVDTFHVSREAPGVPRYENDNYRRQSADITGNWWFISTLWLAQYYLDRERTDKYDDVISTLDWVLSKALSTNMLSEQIDPTNNHVISPAPLTWSHAEYVSTLLDMIMEDNDAPKGQTSRS